MLHIDVTHTQENGRNGPYLASFSTDSGFRWRLVWAALLGLTASAAGIGRLALSGYALALVFQGKPFTTVFWPIAGVAACILLRATLEYIREAVGESHGRGNQTQSA